MDKLTWELNFFIKHYLGAYRGLAFDPAERAALSQVYATLGSYAGRVASGIATIFLLPNSST